jgi:secreted trypsin-like serine protease
MSNAKKKMAFAFALLLIFPAQPAQAVFNGDIQDKNSWVVAITIQSGGKTLLCSGAIVEPTTVMTGKHCVVDSKGIVSSNILINQPGANFYFPATSEMQQRRVSKVVLVPTGPTKEAPDAGDIAFLHFAEPFSNFTIPEVATEDQLKSLKPWSTIKGYGYGATGEDGSIYSKELRQYNLSWGNDDHYIVSTVVIIASASSIGCSGDSGGPITALLEDKREVLIGVAASIVNQGSNGCAQRDLNQLFFENFNLAHPYMMYKNFTPPAPKKKLIVAKKKIIKRK